MKIINYIRSRFTMKFQQSLFTDMVDGRTVCLFTDCFEIEYMATTKFGFRTKRK